MPIEVNVTPFERKELAHPQTGARSHQHERSLSQWQRLNQPSYFIGSQNNGNLLTFAPCRTSRMGFVSQIPWRTP
jgi:hypothetical protein